MRTVNQDDERISEGFDLCRGGVGVGEMQSGCRSYAVRIVAGAATGAFEDRVEAGLERSGLRAECARSNAENERERSKQKQSLNVE
jgi:hypothetical protein